MILMPPRHGKSEQVTVRWAAWNIERNPALRVIIGAYTPTLATSFSRDARNIVKKAPFVHISQEVHAAKFWKTTKGGGCLAVGVGTGVTGFGGNILIVDDPVKSREEANSETYRRKVKNWWTNDLYTRQEPDCLIVVIMTQWHEDDLAGEIMDSEDSESWKIIRLPAIAEHKEDRNLYHKKVGIPLENKDPIGRKPGEALCPTRFDIPFFEEVKRVMGKMHFSALYQQRPQPSEGNMFNRAWFDIQAVLPVAVEAKFVRYWDKAGTKKGGKFTAGVLMMELRGLYYVVDIIRGQWNAVQREKVIKSTAQSDSARYGHVEIWVEQEPGSGGKESAESTIMNLAGFVIKAETVRGDKSFRAEPFAVQADAGNVLLIYGEWNGAFLDEIESFPDGKYNDQGDASGGAFNKLALGFVEISDTELSGEDDEPLDLSWLDDNKNWG